MHRSSMAPCMLRWYLLMFSGLFLSEKITCSCSSQTGIGVFSTVMVAPCCLCTTVDATSIHAWLFRSSVFDCLRRQWNPLIMLDLLSLHLFLNVKHQLGRSFLPFFYNLRFSHRNLHHTRSLPPSYFFIFCPFLILLPPVLPSVYILWPKKHADSTWMKSRLDHHPTSFPFFPVLVSPLGQTENRSKKI